MKTVTEEQFRKMYGDEGLQSFNIERVDVPQEPSLTDVVGTDISNRVSRVGDILNRKDTSAIEKSVQVFGQGAGLAANTLEQTALKVPGIKQAVGAASSAIHWLTTSDASPIKMLGDTIGSSKTLQTAVQLYDNDKNFRDTIDAVANIARLGGDVDMAVNSANFATNVTNKVIRNINKPVIAGAEKPPVQIPTKDISAGIMNRVARLNPSDEIKFKTMAGKTPGEYLTETGNFGTPDKIIANEAMKFTQSMDIVDNELAKLPGVYKEGVISDVLDGIIEKGKSVSTDNVKADYLSRAQELKRQFNSGGLSMKEINEAKRLYEKNVKLGYNKLLNADKVEMATNIDNALRTWQIERASKLGFKNIQALNKQTQIAKFMVNKLGEKLIGQSGLNAINLTDWIMLAGGNPTSVAGFLTKKFFSSRAVQAKIAQILNSGEPTKGLIKADVAPTVENTMRQAFPEGTKLELPAPKPGSPQSQNLVPIQAGAASSMEAPAQTIRQYSFNQKNKKLYQKGKRGGGN